MSNQFGFVLPPVGFALPLLADLAPVLGAIAAGVAIALLVIVVIRYG